MRTKQHQFILQATLAVLLMSPVFAQAGYFNDGVSLYKAGRYSDATDAFDAAIKHHDQADQSQQYLDKIRKETVERIRNRALTGVSKTTWLNKYYYMNNVGSKIQIGISAQEVFERQSLNFRPGAVEALEHLATLLQKNEAANAEISLISEIPLENVQDPQLVARQLATVFSYLSSSAKDTLPTFEAPKPLDSNAH